MWSIKAYNYCLALPVQCVIHVCPAVSCMCIIVISISIMCACLRLVCPVIVMWWVCVCARACMCVHVCCVEALFATVVCAHAFVCRKSLSMPAYGHALNKYIILSMTW